MFYIKIPWLSSVLTFIKEPYQTRISICDVYVNLVIKKEKYVLGRTVHMSVNWQQPFHRKIAAAS